LIVDPEGQAAVRGPYGEDADVILYADITPQSRPAQGDGWESWWNADDR
jgi:hypothetical protein